jgi:hypothetical protein
MGYGLLFTDRQLAILREARFDPESVREYDLFAGGFYWSDERIEAVSDSDTYRVILAYRASLSEGAPRNELLDTWNQLQRACPDWPGFRRERCSPALANDLDEEWKRFEADLASETDD